MKAAVTYTILCALAAIFLLWALTPKHSYDFFILLRFAICGVNAIGVYLAIRRKSAVWFFLLIALAVLFNPLVPIPLKRATWIYVDAATAFLLLLSAGIALWTVRK